MFAKTLIREFFLENGAAAPADGGPFRLNYFSGTGTHVYPLTVASGLKNIYQGTNEVVFEFGGGCLGVAMFDFVGEDAVAHVVAQQVGAVDWGEGMHALYCRMRPENTERVVVWLPHRER